MRDQNKQITISIIVPVYNVEKYLDRCIHSILNQTYKYLEIILVDDGSTDNSGELCDYFSFLDSRVVVIHKKNGGLSSARNAGLEMFSGEYVGFVDSDDWIDSIMYETLLNRALHDETKIVCCGRYDVDENNNKTTGICPKDDGVHNSEDAIRCILNWDGLDSSACDKLFHKSLWSKYRFPEKRISEDVGIMYKVFDASLFISFVNKPFYYYFHRKHSITTAQFSTQKFDLIKNVTEIEYYICKFHPSIFDDFLYFKSVEYLYLFSLLLKSNAKGFEKIEKELSIKLKKCRKIRNRFSLRKRSMLFICTNYFLYKIFKFLLNLF